MWITKGSKESCLWKKATNQITFLRFFTSILPCANDNEKICSKIGKRKRQKSPMCYNETMAGNLRVCKYFFLKKQQSWENFGGLVLIVMVIYGPMLTETKRKLKGARNLFDGGWNLFFFSAYPLSVHVWCTQYATLTSSFDAKNINFVETDLF